MKSHMGGCVCTACINMFVYVVQLAGKILGFSLKLSLSGLSTILAFLNSLFHCYRQKNTSYSSVVKRTGDSLVCRQIVALADVLATFG